MSGGSSGQGAVYTPLPQSISDTDSSEEEELNSIAHHHDNLITNRKTAVSYKKPVDKRNGQKMTDYQLLNNQEISINGFTGQAAQPAIKLENPKQMSCLRKSCFIFSVLFCILTVVLFLWVLPCDWATCSLNMDQIKNPWENTFSGLELKGRISVYPDSFRCGHNMIFMFQGEENISEQSPVNTGHYISPENKNAPGHVQLTGGLISISGINGTVLWFKKYFRVPTDIDCGLIDVDGNGLKDCIVVGSKGLLSVVDPLSGQTIWHLHDHSNPNDTRVMEMDFPLILPDLDGDHVNELATSCSFLPPDSSGTVNKHNFLIVISGKMGSIIGSPLQTGCASIRNLALGKDFMITYTCQDDSGAESWHNIMIQELYTKVTNESLYQSADLKSSVGLNQHVSLKQPSLTVSGHKLVIENKGKCPQCTVHAQVTDSRMGQNDTLWSSERINTYGMAPIAVHFNHSSMGPVSGFVMKFWQWSMGDSLREMTEKKYVSGSPGYRVKRMQLGNQVPQEYFSWSNVDHIRNKVKADADEEISYSSVMKRQIPSFLHGKIWRNVTVNELKEQVVLVTFNETDLPHVINASQIDVVQLCVQEAKQQWCQPDLSLQEHSMLLEDLDGDGSQELISYLTTFTSQIESTKWQLESRVKVIHLETEFPKLYEAVAKH